MIICRVSGGIGSQTCQYIFGRYIEALTGETVYYDTSYFDHRSILNIHKKSAILFNEEMIISDNFFIQGWYLPTIFPKIKTPHYMKELFSTEEYENILRDKNFNTHTIPQLLKEHGLDCLYIAYYKRKNIIDSKYNGEIYYAVKNIFQQMYRHRRDHVNWKKILNSTDNAYINHSISPCSWWFYETVKIIGPQYFDEFTFKNIDNENFNRLYSEISNNNSVGVHFRRGDLTLPQFSNMAPPNSYYRKALNISKKENPGYILYVFSDELDWARDNKNSLGLDQFDDVRYVDIDTDDGLDYLDLYLMAACKSLVIGSSSFSALACLISPNKNNRKDISWQEILNPFLPIRSNLWGLRLKHLPIEIPRRFIPLLMKGLFPK